MRIITISEIKTGYKLLDSPASQYGQYVDVEIDSVRETKNGRFVLTISQTYIAPDGKISERQHKMRYSNGALSGNTTITIK